MSKSLILPIIGEYLGEIKMGKEIGKGTLSHKYIWNPCPICKVPKWTAIVKNEMTHPHCIKCRSIIHYQNHQYVNRKVNNNLPTIGEIRFLDEVTSGGRDTKVIWSACEICGKERWVTLRWGKARSKRCQKCGLIGFISPKSKDNTRECSKCHNIYPATTTYFVSTNSSYLGISRTCKQCDRKMAAKRSRKRLLNGKHRVHSNISTSIRAAIAHNKNGRQWEKLVGYTCKELITHLEKQFTIGMTWDNYGLKGWTVDHIIPVSAFNFKSSDDIDFHKCWALSNLQPMWHKDNMFKRMKIDKPFQPSLAISIKEKKASYNAHQEVVECKS